MKKVLLVLVLVLATLSCQKEEIKPSNQFCESTCGLIVSDNVQDYSIVIRNECSGNEKRFYLTQGDWMNAYVGSNQCMSNTTSW